MVQLVPGLEKEEMNRVLDKTFERYSSDVANRSGEGTSIVWFRNDLRVLDNEALYKGWLSSKVVLPVYCVDPRLFQTTYNFGFPKTGGNYFYCFINQKIAAFYFIFFATIGTPLFIFTWIMLAFMLVLGNLIYPMV